MAQITDMQWVFEDGEWVASEPLEWEPSSSSISSSSSSISSSSSSISSSSLSSSSSSSSSSTSSSSSSSSTSSSSSSTASAGAWAFGEQNPVDEDPVSWQTWSDGTAFIPTIIGDQDWGQLQLECGEEGRSAVYNLGSIFPRIITMREDVYEDGQCYATIQLRHSQIPFNQDDILPAWDDYIVAHNTNDRYIQFRIIKS